MKSTFVNILLLFLSVQLLGQIPAPQEGERWVINASFSDEFEGTELDQSKWHSQHPYWVGRPPAIFMPDAISIQDGQLQIKNYKLAQDSIYTSPWSGNQSTYTMAGGAVVSKSDQAHYGFYEVKMKASRIPMSSTFWMKNRWMGGNADAECPNNITELDIIEAVGSGAPFPAFETHMKSNTHYIHKECGEQEVWHSVGGDSPVGAHVSDDFHTYGCFWKNANEIDFYIDGEKKHTILPSTATNPEPFSRPMFMNMVTETYDWVPPPSVEDLNDDDRNTTYYDWVRSYYLLDVDEPLQEEELIVNGGFETGNFEGWVGWGGNPRAVVSDNVHSGNYAVHIVGAGAPEQVLSLQPNTTYTLSCFAKAISGVVTFGVKENHGAEVFLGGVDVTDAEYTEYAFDFTTGSNANVKFYFFAQAGEEGFADDFKIVETNGSGSNELVMPFDPSLDFYATPSYDLATNIVFPKVEYKASIDRAILIELKDNMGNIIASTTTTALAGYGRKVYELPLTNPIQTGETYTLTAQLFPTADPSNILATTSTTITDFATSNKDLSDEDALEIFPNPASEILNIKNGNQHHFIIYDLLGSVTMEGTIPPNGILNIHNLQQGTYIFTSGRFREVFLRR
ncbi:MAG: carbohydrate binding domain-containing protein [Bacteroidota bacterium]